MSVRETNLVNEVLLTSYKANPNYTHNEHLAWALGILAHTVLRKNHMDNIVFRELNAKLNAILEHKKYSE